MTRARPKGAINALVRGIDWDDRTSPALLYDCSPPARGDSGDAFHHMALP